MKHVKYFLCGLLVVAIAGVAVFSIFALFYYNLILYAIAIGIIYAGGRSFYNEFFISLPEPLIN